MSALVTTYGVGELNALCGVAGAYAEHLSVIHITSAPPIAEIVRHGLLHHTAGDGEYGNMLECARQFSAAQARITPENVRDDFGGKHPSIPFCIGFLVPS